MFLADDKLYGFANDVFIKFYVYFSYMKALE